VHGCFFHMHNCRYGRVIPATNAEFWRIKRLSNAHRDRRNLRVLKREGWRVMIVWECETKDSQRLAKRLKRFLKSQTVR
jgi:DNA mismatch endonuclease (patch repair protein)